jgi:hypothetical protein
MGILDDPDSATFLWWTTGTCSYWWVSQRRTQTQPHSFDVLLLVHVAIDGYPRGPYHVTDIFQDICNDVLLISYHTATCSCFHHSLNMCRIPNVWGSLSSFVNQQNTHNTLSRYLYNITLLLYKLLNFTPSFDVMTREQQIFQLPLGSALLSVCCVKLLKMQILEGMMLIINQVL